MLLIDARRRRGSLLILLTFVLFACASTSHPPARYLVTESPIDVGVGTGLCVAVDPADQHGIWWWQPGASGCGSRSTGPGVFHAEEATVSRPTPAGETALGFRVGTHSATRPFIEVRLVMKNGRMRALESGAEVAVQPRTVLDVPEMP
jgi:hypothetical protein